MQILKEEGAKVLGKVVALLLAAFGMMMRIGIQGWIRFSGQLPWEG